ncbi:RNA polymerase sigma-70 factor [Chitinophaga lutea]
MDQLAARLKNGDEEALKALMDLVGPKVLGYCRKKTNNTQDAEELVLDIFLKLWQFREKIDTAANLEVLLFTIARNHILNFIRNAAIRQLAIVRPEEAQAHEENAILRRLDQAELLRQYEQVLSRLGEKQRRVFRMSREEGLSHREIAEQMSISVRTVEAHIHSSLKIIRTEMKDAYILLVLLLLR